MSKFSASATLKSSAQPAPDTVNLAGGQAYAQEPRLELVSLMLTSLVQPQAYRAEGEGLARLLALIDLVDPLFAAKATLYARSAFGMRSVSHAAAGHLAKRISGQPWARRFFKALVVRPDDIMETLAFSIATNGWPLPNAMRRGFADALSAMDEYQLAKYRGGSRGLSLIDAVNLCHPKGTKESALGKLMTGTLPPAETWETKLSAAGQDAEDGEAKTADAWASLLNEGKLGYLALVRNLRNIASQAPACIDLACAQLVDPKRIHGSRIFPFQLDTAMRQLSAVAGTGKIMRALSDAVNLSCANVPKFPGKTLVVVDCSGSMSTAMSGRSATMVIDIAALFAAVILRSQADAELMLFAEQAGYATANPSDSATTIAEGIRRLANGGGTNFHAIFGGAHARYDRIIILSDMQGWIQGPYGPNMPVSFAQYCARHNAKPFLYSWDLAGAGTTQLPADRIFCMAGFSDRIFEVMARLEEDRHALVATVEAVDI